MEDLVIWAKEMLSSSDSLQKGREMLLRGTLTGEIGILTFIAEESSELIGLVLEESMVRYIQACKEQVSQKMLFTYILYAMGTFSLFLQHKTVWPALIGHLKQRVKSEMQMLNNIPFHLFSENHLMMKSYEMIFT